MSERMPETADKEDVPLTREKSGNRTFGRRSSLFKYYIHDRVDALRLQLVGEFSEAEVSELNGCWNTAKTTLGDRTLILDLRGLEAVDDVARKWLLLLADEGATCVPESFLRSGVSQTRASQPAKTGFFAKLGAMLRGSGAVAAE